MRYIYDLFQFQMIIKERPAFITFLLEIDLKFKTDLIGNELSELYSWQLIIFQLNVVFFI